MQMANPLLGKPNGAIMSLGRVLNAKKHGGAHVVKHEPLEDTCLRLSERFLVSETLSQSENNVCDSERNQDGDQKLHDNDDNALGENLPFLPELGTDCLDNYDSAVVENNTEWLKARCKNFGQVEFDITPQTTGDDALDFPGISIDSKVILQNCDSFTTVSHSFTTDSHNVSSSNAITSHDKIVDSKLNIHGNGYATPYLSLPSAQISDVGINSVTLPSSLDASLEHVIMNAVGVPNAVEVAANGSSENITFTDFNILNSKLYVKDGILSVMPQNTPIVASNDSVYIKNDHIIQASTISSQENCTATPMQQETLLLSLNNSNIQNVTNTQNLTELATISIATDKPSNLTKILVNTSHGQQTYHLNISDLTKIQSSNVVPKEFEKPATLDNRDVQQAQTAYNQSKFSFYLTLSFIEV